MRSFRQWILWTMGIVPRVIQTILLTLFVLPVFCDVKMWRAMIREVWQLPEARAEKPVSSSSNFEVIRGNKQTLKGRPQRTGSSR